MLDLAAIDDTALAPTAEKGPTNESVIVVPAPITAGPRMRLRTTRAPASTTTLPSSSDSSSTVAVDATVQGLEDEAVGVQQRGQLPGVDPPAVEDLGPHRQAPVDEPLNGVGDLEFAPRRRRDGGHRLVHALVEEVHADQGQIRRVAAPGFSSRRTTEPSSSSSATPNRCGSGTALSRIWAPGAGRRLVQGEGQGRAGRSASKRATKSLRLCSSRLSPRYMTKSSEPRKSRAIRTAWARPRGAGLREIGDLQAPRGAIPDRGLDLRRGVADHDADLFDTGIGDGLEPVKQDGLVGHRHQLLGPGVGDGAQTGPRPACQDERLHRATLPATPARPIRRRSGPRSGLRPQVGHVTRRHGHRRAAVGAHDQPPVGVDGLGQPRPAGADPARIHHDRSADGRAGGRVLGCRRQWAPSRPR